jgi:hypothetical protein
LFCPEAVLRLEHAVAEQEYEREPLVTVIEALFAVALEPAELKM